MRAIYGTTATTSVAEDGRTVCRTRRRCSEMAWQMVGGDVMRCLLCDAEMILVNVVQDDTMAVTGFEHRTFMCSSCHDVERRLVFVGAAEAILVSATPSIDSEPSDSGPVPPLDTTP